MSRKYTCKVLEMMDAGLIDPSWLAVQLAGWCSEDDMKEFYENNFEDDEDEDEE